MQMGRVFTRLAVSHLNPLTTLTEACCENNLAMSASAN